MRCAVRPESIQNLSAGGGDYSFMRFQHVSITWLQKSMPVCYLRASSDPKRAIESAILDRFAHVLGREVDLAVEIGDGARNFQAAIVSIVLLEKAWYHVPKSGKDHLLIETRTEIAPLLKGSW